MNAKHELKDPFESAESLTRFIDLYEQLTEWQQLQLNIKMFGYLVGHFVRDCKGQSLAENRAALVGLADFFTVTIWPIIRQPVLMLTLAAIAGVLWGITMYRLGL